ncbi:TonB-dependent receptor plug domain-containing protein [Psychroflexus montanilacus]|uniref:TonB-dependent receptor plug domain-containing protein n=1 Tax=Psychroflexus montanilacus TaxID=2873598 RepID=UPI001CCB0079|nr:TonB-dependent receptor plug domain-containing protein [Psychroflexus montanilacus]MBZ9651640.1 TonB-dependent receptor [Psychroflexus montanilacus]
MKLTKLYFILLLGFVLSQQLRAQSLKNPENLVSYLKVLETEYDVFFSYADDQIDNVAVNRTETFETIKGHLNHLQKKTPFDYIIQSETNILVVPKPYLKTICISVTDELSNKPISKSVLKSENFTFQSDQKGYFKIPVNTKKVNFTVIADDFVNKQFNIDTRQDFDCYDLKLTPFFEILDEVLLSNFLTSGIQKFASGGLEINYEEFGLLPGLVEPDVLQSLQALPGITSRKESVSYLNVRGGTHDQNLFLWDGIKMYHTSHFFGMISAFNPYMAQKVTLIKNGTSSKYGDGVSSLIDMETGDSIVDHFKAGIGLNLINTDAIIEAPLTNASSVEFSFRRSINSIWESPTYNSYFDKVFQNTEVTNFETPTSQQNDDFSFYDATFNYKHQLSKRDYLKANFFYARDEFSLNRFDVEGNRINTRSSDLGQTNVAGGVYYERNWSTSTKSQVQFYTSRYNQTSVNSNLLDDQSLEQINEVREIGVRLNFQTQLSTNFAMESGYQLNETGILNSENIDNPGFFRETQNSILTNSIYSQLNYQSKNNRLNLNLGGRLNHFSKFDQTVIEPRFNLSYQFLDDLFLEVLAEQKSQTTSQSIDLQTDFLGVENRRWVLSNPNNRPVIQSQQVSTGLNYIKPSWFINADFYYKKVDGITTQGQGFQNQFRFIQSHGSYEIKGVDLLINKSFEPISGWVSYSLSENNYQFEELLPSTFRNNLDMRHVVSAGLSFQKNGLKISTGFNWHSGVTTTLPSANQPPLLQQIVFQDPNAERLSDYFRVDFSSTYRFPLFKNVQALTGISFWNLFGNSNIFNQFYGLDGNQNIETYRQRGLNFTPNFVFRLRF